MSGAYYSIYLCDPFGVRIADASAFVSLKYSRVVNDVGTMTLVLPGSFDGQLIRAPDGRVEIWRRLPDMGREVLETETVWLIKKVTNERDDDGRTTTIIEADTPLCVLREPGRFIDISEGVAADSNFFDDAYDDMIKMIAGQNIGAGIATARDLTAYITIAPNLTLAPVGSKAVSWRACLKAMQEIADASAQQGVYLAFDIMAPTPNTLEFRTYIQQRGVDHRFPAGLNPVIISPDFGNMGECSISTDWRNEITFARAGGRGEGSNRLTATAQDSTRIGLSPFGRREKFVQATQYETTTGLQAEAEAVVRQGRPKRIFRGKLLDVPDTRYGVHWGWGDFVTVQDFGQSFDARIDAIEVTVARGKETISAWVRGDL